MDNIYVTKTLIETGEQSDLDFELYEEFGYDSETSDEFVKITKDDGDEYYAEAYPIRVDKLIEVLGELKKKGVTHVQLEDHCDHHGYLISGYEIRLSTTDEISSYENERNQINERNEKMKELQKQMDELKGGGLSSRY